MLYYNLLPYLWNFKGKSEKNMNILFVCTGNSCRSPMAEAYFNMLVERDGRTDIYAESAGIHTYDGCSASLQAQIVAKSFGGDLSNFRSQRFLRTMAAEFDLIIAMTRSHLVAIKEIAPDANVKLLSDYADWQNPDVPDPYGENVDGYARVFRFMKDALDSLYSNLTNSNTNS